MKYVGNMKTEPYNIIIKYITCFEVKPTNDDFETEDESIRSMN